MENKTIMREIASKTYFGFIFAMSGLCVMYGADKLFNFQWFFGFALYAFAAYFIIDGLQLIGINIAVLMNNDGRIKEALQMVESDLSKLKRDVSYLSDTDGCLIKRISVVENAIKPKEKPPVKVSVEEIAKWKKVDPKRIRVVTE